MSPRHKNVLQMTNHETEIPRLAEINNILADVPALQRNKVVSETQAFYQARQQAGIGYLAMGEHLLAVRNILEPLEKWTLFVGLLPNITQATAYRMIWAFENVSRALPKATRDVAIRDGYKLISAKKDETFAPGYEKAVQEVTKTIGAAPEKDETEARKWLQAVMQTKRRLSKRGARAETVVTIETREAKIVQDVQKAISAVPEDQRTEFGLRVVGMIVNLCHVPTYRVKPVNVPKHYLKGAQAA